MQISELNSKLLLKFRQDILPGASFHSAINDARETLGIKSNGLKSFDELEKWEVIGGKTLTNLSNRKKLLTTSATKIAEDLNLPSYIIDLIVAYLVFDKNYLEYPCSDLKDFGCEVQFSRSGYASIKIYPEAARDDILSFVEKRYDWISHYLQQDGRTKQIRRRPKMDRNKKIFQYYKMNLLRYNGQSNTPELQKINKNYTAIKHYDPSLEDVDVETIRKAIQSQKKLRK